jgi:hypothetical protein
LGRGGRGRGREREENVFGWKGRTTPGMIKTTLSLF